MRNFNPQASLIIMYVQDCLKISKTSFIMTILLINNITNFQRPPSRTSSVSSLNLAFPEPKKPKPKAARTPKRKSRLKLRRKGSKKRKGSKSRSRGSASDFSDSEALSTASTPRSDSSRVSFDMVPSDIDEPPTRGKYNSHLVVTEVSLENICLLACRVEKE